METAPFICDLMQALSLMYHDVVEAGASDSSGFCVPGASAYKLYRPEFEAHLDAIAGLDPQPTVSVVNRHRAPETGTSLFLTFDDGGSSAYAVGGLLEQHGWRGHFFITTDYIGK